MTQGLSAISDPFNDLPPEVGGQFPRVSLEPTLWLEVPQVLKVDSLDSAMLTEPDGFSSQLVGHLPVDASDLGPHWSV